MTGRNRRDDAASDNFCREFPGRPVGNRSAGLLGQLTGKSDYLGVVAPTTLTDLLGGDASRRAGSWVIAEAFGQAQFSQGHRRKAQPPRPPLAGSIDGDSEFAGDVFVVESIGAGKDHTGTDGQLLWCGVGTGKSCKGLRVFRG